jgi:hypothetical protein
MTMSAEIRIGWASRPRFAKHDNGHQSERPTFLAEPEGGIEPMNLNDSSNPTRLRAPRCDASEPAALLFSASCGSGAAGSRRLCLSYRRSKHRSPSPRRRTSGQSSRQRSYGLRGGIVPTVLFVAYPSFLFSRVGVQSADIDPYFLPSITFSNVGSELKFHEHREQRLYTCHRVAPGYVARSLRCPF